MTFEVRHLPSENHETIPGLGTFVNNANITAAAIRDFVQSNGISLPSTEPPPIIVISNTKFWREHSRSDADMYYLANNIIYSTGEVVERCRDRRIDLLDDVSSYRGLMEELLHAATRGESTESYRVGFFEFGKDTLTQNLPPGIYVYPRASEEEITKITGIGMGTDFGIPSEENETGLYYTEAATGIVRELLLRHTERHYESDVIELFDIQEETNNRINTVTCDVGENIIGLINRQAITDIFRALTCGDITMLDRINLLVFDERKNTKRISAKNLFKHSPLARVRLK